VIFPGYLYHGIGDQGFQIMQTTRFGALRGSDICSNMLDCEQAYLVGFRYDPYQV